MVNIPFVSEDFQRAFRNQFPSQTQTGRDLHVSDIVIPIVDFSPTASGASLPFELRDTYNPSATFANYNTAQTGTEVIGTPGFWSLRFNLSYNGGTFSPSVIFNFKTTSLDGLQVNSPQESLNLAKLALQGEHDKASSMICMTAGAALYLSDIASSLEAGVELAKGSLESGAGLKKLNQLVEFTSQFK